MKKIMCFLMVSYFVSFLFPVLGYSKTPSCSQNDVKKLVLQIRNNEIKNHFNKQAKQEWIRSSQKDQENYIRKTTKRANSLYDLVHMISLTDIRTKSINKDIKKCECEGNMTWTYGGDVVPVRYNVQYTDEGELYIEVEKLRIVLMPPSAFNLEEISDMK